ncbi:MAG TPA: phage holin family protein [Cryptosporangiaceae bacterium]|nr:phage holin family protein [Cryptosporangiaceae bacterium]
MSILIKVLVTAVALWASTVLDGIGLRGDSIWVNAGTLLVVAVIFGVLNAILKPIIKTVGCGLYVLTLGLIGLVVNALLFLLVGWLSEQFKLPFEVDGFWAGFWGAIIVTVVSFLLHLVIPDSSDKD